MRNTIITILVCSILSSCATYLDKKNSNSDFYELDVYETYNIYKNKNQIKETADTEVYNRNNFEIRLPKNIVNWESGSYDIFEYSSKQIIFINAGNDKENNKKEWTFRDANNNEILNNLDSYWYKRGYSSKGIENPNKNRISKIYSNNVTTILLFNIKQENFEDFKNQITTFKYVK